MNLFSKRSRHRILRHHVLLAAASGGASVLVYGTISTGEQVYRWSLSTGYVAFGLLAATLGLGALNVLQRKRNPVSSDLRRDVGIWCGIVGGAHVIFGLQVHMGGRIAQYFFSRSGDGGWLLPRLDLFGFANYTGLLAAVVILFLLVLSNDISLSRLKAERWKFLQKFNYAVFVLVVLHSIAYQYIESRNPPYMALFWVIAGGTMMLQLLGFRRIKSGAGGALDRNRTGPVNAP